MRRIKKETCLRRQERKKKKGKRGSWWRWLVVLGVVAWVGKGVAASKIGFGKGRFNLVVVEGERVVFVTVDALEERVSCLDLPENLLIKSRSGGNYRVGRLMSLSAYEKDPGEFVRRKMQGFLRVPIGGYLLSSKLKMKNEKVGDRRLVTRGLWRGRGNLSLWERLILIKRSHSYSWHLEGVEELVRAGVLTKENEGGEEVYKYDEARLFEYTRERFFDWLVAEEGLSAAVVDESGLGVGKEVAQLLENWGVNVVRIKEKGGEREKSELLVGEEKWRRTRAVKSLERFLGLGKVGVGDLSEYRAEIVLKVGKDMERMF